jgi:hypothetical protein
MRNNIKTNPDGDHREKNNLKKKYRFICFISLCVVSLYSQNNTTMRRNAKRIIDLRTELINEIKNFVNGTGDKLEFTTTFNVGVDTIEFDDDYQKILRTAEYITNDGFIIDEEGTEVPLDELGTVELGFILDELEENKFEIF